MCRLKGRHELDKYLHVILGEEHKPFIFMRRKIQLITSTTESNLILGYDVEENVNYLFLVRPCTASEKQIARENLTESMTTLSQLDISRSNLSASFMTDPNKSETPHHKSSLGSTPNQSNWKNRFHRTPRWEISPVISRVQDRTMTDSATSRLFFNLSQQASQSQTMDTTKAADILSTITGEVETEFSKNNVELSLECIWTDKASRANGKNPSRLPIFSSLQASAPVFQRSNQARNRVEKEITEQFAKVGFFYILTQANSHF